MISGLRLHWPPLPLLSALTLLMFVLTGISAWIAMDRPWLGIALEAAGEHGVRVTQVSPDGPASGQLAVGDVLTGLVGEQHGYLSLADYDPGDNPHASSTFQNYAAYLERQGRFDDVVREHSLTLVLTDGTQVSLTPAPQRPLSDLPAAFWLLNLFGFMAALISLSVWVFRPGLWPARLLALSGVGFYLAIFNHGIWEARELALPQTLFDLLMRANHLALHTMLLALLILLASYPTRIGRGLWVPITAICVVGIILLNENLMLVELPVHSFYLPILLYYFGGITLALLQWQRTQQQPLDRAALLWFLLSIMATMGTGLVVYYLPMILGQPPITSLTAKVGLAVSLYIGFALGVLRYQLFQLERWWFIGWAWFLGGLAVIALDLLVVSIFDLHHRHALLLSVIGIAWLYFPIRQWLWQRFTRNTAVNLGQILPPFLESLLLLPEAEISAHWQTTLKQLFLPLTLRPSEQKVTTPALAAHGSRLYMPDIGSNRSNGFVLLYGQHGRKLFNQSDLEQAQALSAIATRVHNLNLAHKQIAKEERRRIMRDLHDDVGGRLLTLIHTANNPEHEEQARAALNALRETIHLLDDRRRYTFADLLADWQASVKPRLVAAGWQLKLDIQPDIQELPIPARHYLNLRRILDEAATNAIEHGLPGTLHFSLSCDSVRLRLTLDNNQPTNRITQPTHLRGRGLSHIDNRATELGGELQVYCRTEPSPGFVLVLELPLQALIPVTGNYPAIKLP